ncbi:MAG: helix-hairpin-helix domain-containing protein [bacterium]|nr:helix-hairpin-helix domain-containing protein [bacterium]
MASQTADKGTNLHRPGRRPKRWTARQIYILQGLPGIGPKLATNLLDHFGSIEKIFTAPCEELIKVSGMGRKKAEGIRKIVSSKFKNLRYSYNGYGVCSVKMRDKDEKVDIDRRGASPLR